MKRTGKGELLIEINGGADSAEAMRAEVARSFGPGTKIRKIKDPSAIEVRDLDEQIIREILNAASVPVGSNIAWLVRLRKNFGGAQTLVVLSITVARHLCTGGRLRVDLVYAKVRST